MTDEAKAIVPVPEHIKLNEAVKAEKSARAQKVMAMVEAICKENNCLFIAYPKLEEVPGGGFIIKAYPGVAPL